MFKKGYSMCVDQMNIKDKAICVFPLAWVKICELKSYIKKMK